MGIDPGRRGRHRAKVERSAWLCLVAWAIVGVPTLQAQSIPANQPTALEQLRAVVGLDLHPAEPRHLGDAPAAVRLVNESVRVTPAPVFERPRPIRLDRVERIVDDLAILNRLTPPDSPPLLPVEALAPKREMAPVVLEMPTPKPAPAERAPSPAPEIPRASAKAVVPASGPWELVGMVLCLVLIGTFFAMALFLVSRWVGLKLHFRVLLGSPGPRLP